MLHFKIGNRHEYWENDAYVKHMKEPLCNRWHPYYVCYCYEFYATVEAFDRGEITYEDMKGRLNDYGIEIEPVQVQL